MTTYERIVSESFQLFVKYGIRSVTMDDIARHMGISKKTIYEHFRDKDDLLKQGMLHHKEQQDKNIRYFIATSSNVLDAIFKVMFESASNMHKVHVSFFTDLQKYHHSICQEFIPRHQHEKTNLIQELLDRGVADGVFRNDIDTSIVAKLFNHQLKALTDDEMFPSGEYSKAQIFRIIIENYMHGIATGKGIEIIEELISKNK